MNNAFSATAKQCSAFTNGASGGDFTGPAAHERQCNDYPRDHRHLHLRLYCGGVESAVVTVTVGNPTLTIATTSLPDGQADFPYSQAVVANNGTQPYTFSIASGSLPAGLTLNPNTGVIVGFPTQGGASSFTVKVTDSASTPATATAALTINITPPPPPAITTTTLSSGDVGVAYSQSIGVHYGSLPYIWSIASGTLPPGLTLSPDTGIISGTPTTVGTFPFTAKIVDSESPALSATGKPEYHRCFANAYYDGNCDSDGRSTRAKRHLHCNGHRSIGLANAHWNRSVLIERHQHGRAGRSRKWNRDAVELRGLFSSKIFFLHHYRAVLR